jgi:hypothetical protein
MARAAKSVTTTAVVLPKFDLRTFELRLVGDSPLIVHNWSEKAKKAMLAKQMKVPIEAKEAKDPHREFEDSLYPFPGGGYGFKIVAFKSAAVDACSHIAGVTKVEARGAFHIGLGLQNRQFLSTELVKILKSFPKTRGGKAEHAEPTMREDMVKIAMGTADIRYRAEFWPWCVMFPIRYNASVLSLEQIVHLFNHAGFGIGVGEWRTQRDGDKGMFHVALDDE